MGGGKNKTAGRKNGKVEKENDEWRRLGRKKRQIRSGKEYKKKRKMDEVEMEKNEREDERNSGEGNENVENEGGK